MGVYWQKALKKQSVWNDLEQRTCSTISLPMGDEVKNTQKGDDGHLSAIINSTLYRAVGGRNQLHAIMSRIAVELAIQIVCCEIDKVN